jgi:hypothetical protein
LFLLHPLHLLALEARRPVIPLACETTEKQRAPLAPAGFAWLAARLFARTTLKASP